MEWYDWGDDVIPYIPLLGAYEDGDGVWSFTVIALTSENGVVGPGGNTYPEPICYCIIEPPIEHALQRMSTATIENLTLPEE